MVSEWYGESTGVSERNGIQRGGQEERRNEMEDDERERSGGQTKGVNANLHVRQARSLYC